MSSEVMKEAHRLTTICNACRYCEGYCAVFPAMELRRTFTDGELKYMANLCHNCRGCYYCCQYAPPHEFDLNYPMVMAALRRETYAEFIRPRFLAKLFKNNGLWVWGLSLLATVLLVLGSCARVGIADFFAKHTGEEIFYQVIPYSFLLVVFTLIFLASCVFIVSSVFAMWQITGSKFEILFNLKNHVQAIKDAGTLRYLDGNGEGCNYPDDSFSFIRRTFHHFTFYGFLGCVVTTAIAFFTEHAIGIPHPFAWYNPIVILGFVSGVSLCFGTAGLVYLKAKMDPRPYDAATTGMDNAFTSLLFLISFTGLALLFVRSTEFMGLMLCIHLGLVLGFFLTMPCSKFVHMVYRYAALVRNAQEQRDGKA